MVKIVGIIFNIALDEEEEIASEIVHLDQENSRGCKCRFQEHPVRKVGDKVKDSVGPRFPPFPVPEVLRFFCTSRFGESFRAVFPEP